MIQIQDMFENGKPDIVLKTAKRFNIIRTPIIILIQNKFKIVVPVMFNKMLVLVFNILLIDFYSGIWAGITRIPSLSICAKC